MPVEPRIAAVIPAYNAAQIVAAAVESLRGQTVAPAEIIVVDDGSRDDTSAVAARAGARVIRQENGGPAAARNRGIAATSAEWIALLDADDISFPTRIERQREWLDGDRHRGDLGAELHRRHPTGGAAGDRGFLVALGEEHDPDLDRAGAAPRVGSGRRIRRVPRIDRRRGLQSLAPAGARRLDVPPARRGVGRVPADHGESDFSDAAVRRRGTGERGATGRATAAGSRRCPAEGVRTVPALRAGAVPFPAFPAGAAISPRSGPPRPLGWNDRFRMWATILPSRPRVGSLHRSGPTE